MLNNAEYSMTQFDLSTLVIQASDDTLVDMEARAISLLLFRDRN